MEVGDFIRHGLPFALTLIEVPVQDQMLLRPVRSLGPSSISRVHRMDVDDDKPAPWLQHPEDFVRVAAEIGKITLVQVRHGQVEGCIFEEIQVLYISYSVRVAFTLPFPCGNDHWLAQVDAQYVGCVPIGKDSAKTAFAASAIENSQPGHIATGVNQRPVE